jgi:hypothetical protein
MALISAFQPQGYTVSLTTNATGATSNSALITTTAINAPYKPVQFRMVNVGTDYIWVSFTQTGTAVVVPTPGTGASYGTPTQAIRLVPLVVEVFTVQQWVQNAGNVAGSGFYCNNISNTASQTFDITFGEGV